MKAKAPLTNLLVILGLCALASCAKTTAPTAADIAANIAAAEADVRRSAESFKGAIMSRDIEKTLSFYTADAWLLPQNGPIAHSDADRRVYWKAIAALPIERDIVEVADRIDIATSGDMAVQYGEFRQVLMGKAGAFSSVTQKFINGWRRQADGNWKVTVSMASVGN